jgi:hypothetical protein
VLTHSNLIEAKAAYPAANVEITPPRHAPFLNRVEHHTNPETIGRFLVGGYLSRSTDRHIS